MRLLKIGLELNSRVRVGIIVSVSVRATVRVRVLLYVPATPVVCRVVAS